MTTAEYLAGPETLNPRELAYGVLRVADAPLVPHQRVVGQLFIALSRHVQACRFGEVWISPIDVILDVDRALVVQPDLLVVSEERRAIVRERIYGAPDLMIEVLSPDARVGTIGGRLRWLASYGVRECWLVRLPERSVEVLEFAGGGIRSRETFGADTPIRSSVLSEFHGTLGSMIGY